MADFQTIPSNTDILDWIENSQEYQLINKPGEYWAIYQYSRYICSGYTIESCLSEIIPFSRENLDLDTYRLSILCEVWHKIIPYIESDGQKKWSRCDNFNEYDSIRDMLDELIKERESIHGNSY